MNKLENAFSRNYWNKWFNKFFSLFISVKILLSALFTVLLIKDLLNIKYYAGLMTTLIVTRGIIEYYAIKKNGVNGDAEETKRVE